MPGTIPGGYPEYPDPLRGGVLADAVMPYKDTKSSSLEDAFCNYELASGSVTNESST